VAIEDGEKENMSVPCDPMPNSATKPPMNTQANTEKKKPKVLPKLTPPKESYIMGRLFIEAAVCKDPDVQHAAFVVNNVTDEVIGFGVNYIPTDYQHKNPSWEHGNKVIRMVFAEEAALDRALKRSDHAASFANCHMYVTGPPSLRAVRSCLRIGLKAIIYANQIPNFFDEKDWKAAQSLATEYSLGLRKFDGNLHWLRDRIKRIQHLF